MNWLLYAILGAVLAGASFVFAKAGMRKSNSHLAAALRGTGDTRFVMMVAGGSMFAFRIGAAYIFVKVFNMGIVGTWVAMVSDWAIRSVIFYVRFKRGKWSRNKVI